MKRARHLWLARGAEAALSVAAPPYADFLWWIRQLAAGAALRAGRRRARPPARLHGGRGGSRRAVREARAVAPRVARDPARAHLGHPRAAGLDDSRCSSRARATTRIGSGCSRSIPATARPSASTPPPRAPTTRRSAASAARPPLSYLPCCWQAGEIVKSHCADPDSDECRERVEEARRLALEAGRDPQWVLPNAAVEEWLDCDQVRGEFKSALSPRPYESAQVALALESASERDANGDPLRFRFGLIGSSDTHSARAGSGYKQIGRKGMTDARGFGFERAERWTRALVGSAARDPGRAVPTPRAEAGFRGLLDVERGASFLYPGGLVAVHSTGRDRRSIWDALVRREVYATSGPRILLWFDLLNGPNGRAPMGSAVVQRETPRFEVRAVGSFVQQPGCPAHAREALSPERLERLCLGECYYPSDRREPIEAIEIVRIRPGADPSDLAARIEDPWLRVPCPPDPAGCVIQFEDRGIRVGATACIMRARSRRPRPRSTAPTCARDSMAREMRSASSRASAAGGRSVTTSASRRFPSARGRRRYSSIAAAHGRAARELGSRAARARISRRRPRRPPWPLRSPRPLPRRLPRAPLLPWSAPARLPGRSRRPRRSLCPPARRVPPPGNRRPRTRARRRAQR